jgi:hypothetical protein
MFWKYIRVDLMGGVDMLEPHESFCLGIFVEYCGRICCCICLFVDVRPISSVGSGGIWLVEFLLGVFSLCCSDVCVEFILVDRIGCGWN